VFVSSYNFIRWYFSPKRKLFLKLRRILGFYPGNLLYYELAFTHKSASWTATSNSLFALNNERLEYLGDAVLDAVVAEYVYDCFPEKDEGFLTQIRSRIVKRNFLDYLAFKIGVHKLIVTHIPTYANRKHLYGNAFEALIGAIYKDKGYKTAQKFIIRRIIHRHVNLDKIVATESDFKSRLIEWGQKNKYEISFECHEEYPESDNIPIFVSSVIILERNCGTGVGNSKKEAEQNAAQQALIYVEGS
jgi:ribonuclease III